MPRQLLRAVAFGAARARSRSCRGCAGPTVRRVWPDRLEVSLEEHVAFARWGSDGAREHLRRALHRPRPTRACRSSSAPPAPSSEMTQRYHALRRRGGAARREPRARRAARRAAPGSLALDSGLQLELGRDADAPRRASRRFVERLSARRSADSRAGTSTSTCAIRTASPCALPELEQAARPMPQETDKNLIVGPRHRHLEGRVPRGGDHARRLARDPRHGQPRVAGPEEGRGGEHRGHGERDPARARGSRADGRLQDHARCSPASPAATSAASTRTGMVAIKDKEVSALDVDARDRDRARGQHPDRSADPAHPAPGIHHRRPGGRARADRHERHAPRGEGAHRDRRGVRGAEHHEVRAPLRARGAATSSCSRSPRRDAVLSEDEKDLGVCLVDIGGGTTDIAIFTARRDPAHGGDPDRRRPDHQRHRDGAAHADRPTPRSIKTRHGVALRQLAEPERDDRGARASASARRARCRARRSPR